MSFTILLVDASVMGERSVTRKLTAQIIASLKAHHPDSTVITRDLGKSPLPHIDGLTIAGMYAAPDERNEALQQALKASDEAIEELQKADVIVIGAPMYNFGIPSSLKAWIDHVVRRGLTFRIGPSGYEGLINGKKVIVASARGGIYSTGPNAAMDYQESYLKAVLGFLGLKDISFVRAEGVAMGEEASKKAFQSAETHLAEALEKIRDFLPMASG
jgi:FMN-dependent NADH-azoreductase